MNIQRKSECVIPIVQGVGEIVNDLFQIKVPNVMNVK